MATTKKYLVLFRGYAEYDGEYMIGTMSDVIDGLVDAVLDFEDEGRVEVYEYPSMDKVDVSLPERVITLSKDGKVIKQVKC